MDQQHTQVTVRWIADDTRHHLHGGVQRISFDSMLSVNNRDVDDLGPGALLNLQVSDLLSITTWPMWSAVVMPMYSDAAAAPPAKKQRTMIASKNLVRMDPNVLPNNVLIIVRMDMCFYYVQV